MFAYKKPFTETLVIEMEGDEVLSLHGQIVRNDIGIAADTFLSILEAFTAGTNMERFAPPCECGNPIQDSPSGKCWNCYNADNANADVPIKPIHRQINKPTFRNHDEEIRWNLQHGHSRTGGE